MDEYVRLEPGSGYPTGRSPILLTRPRIWAPSRSWPAASGRYWTSRGVRILESREPSGRQHRVVLGAGDRLGVGRDLGFVGFFAVKRVGMDHAPLTRTDDELIDEPPGHPGILSYSSLELADGNWGNLILLDPPEAGEHWRTSARHARAASELRRATTRSSGSTTAASPADCARAVTPC